MPAILLDVDGVFHVSGEPIAGGAAAVEQLREDGHRLRFITNNTTRTRAQLAEELRAMGISLDDEELQRTTELIKQHIASQSAILPIQRRLLELRRQLAGYRSVRS